MKKILFALGFVLLWIVGSIATMIALDLIMLAVATIAGFLTHHV